MTLMPRLADIRGRLLTGLRKPNSEPTITSSPILASQRLMQLLQAAGTDNENEKQPRACTAPPPNTFDEREIHFVKQADTSIPRASIATSHCMDEPIDDEFIEEPSDGQPMSGAEPSQEGP